MTTRATTTPDSSAHDAVQAADQSAGANDLSVTEAATRAGEKIAPFWPLQHFVAVNPMLGLAENSLIDSEAILARAAGARLLMPRSYYHAALDEQRITDDDLVAAIAELQSDVPKSMTSERIRQLAGEPEVDPAQAQLPTVASLAAECTETDWSSFLVSNISTWAGDYFDRGIAAWRSPFRNLDPWPSYRARASIDRSAQLLGLDRARARFADLPDDTGALLEALVTTLNIPSDAVQAYFHRLLSDVSGWAGYARYLGWEGELSGATGAATSQLLAIRAAWELVLHDCLDNETLRERWTAAVSQYACVDHAQWRSDRAVDHVLHTALERSEQRRLAAMLTDAGTAKVGNAQASVKRAALQAVFCIDVRSERIRRALEQVWPDAETLGFAGFFGLSAAHQDASGSVSARCPVLLAPKFSVDERMEARDAAALSPEQELGLAARWSRFRRAAIACFGYVESAGFVYTAKLLRATLGRATSSHGQAPAINAPTTLSFDMPIDARIAATENMLRGMSLTDGFAPLVLLVGHGASSANNPYASALDCGACGGHAGDINARLAAAMLNDQAVRDGLFARGIKIPPDTVFAAALHNTTTDEIGLEVSPHLEGCRPETLDELRRNLTLAGEIARAERAPTLGLPVAAAKDGRLIRRSHDWSQVRPEWGLAGCAAFIAAPRSRTRGMSLEARSFLHNYDWRLDKEFKVLETIMTAPLVVASWITLQYFASTVDNRRFGSGDKTLHNIVGGVGVLEGLSGDLRTGLPVQSLHSGSALVHQPVRLTAVIEAPTDALNRVIESHDALRALIDNQWIQLHALDEYGRMWRRQSGGQEWFPVDSSAISGIRAA